MRDQPQIGRRFGISTLDDPVIEGGPTPKEIQQAMDKLNHHRLVTMARKGKPKPRRKP